MQRVMGHGIEAPVRGFRRGRGGSPVPRRLPDDGGSQRGRGPGPGNLYPGRPPLAPGERHGSSRGLRLADPDQSGAGRGRAPVTATGGTGGAGRPARTRRRGRGSRAAGDRRPGRVPLGARAAAAQGARRAGAAVLGRPAGGGGRGGPRLLGGHRQEHRIAGGGPARRDPRPRPAARRPARRLSRYEERHVMITDELEQELRSALAASAQSAPLPPQARQRLLQRDYHPRRVNRGLAATVAAGAIAAAGVTVPLAAGGGPLTAGGGPAPATTGAVIQLASHTFRMPAGYQRTAATSPPCHAIAFSPLTDLVQRPHVKGPLYRTPRHMAGMKAAASA